MMKLENYNAVFADENLGNRTDDKEMSEESDTDKRVVSTSLLSGILNNALSTAQQFQKTSAGLETKRCPNCSAARPADTDLRYCAFCNHTYY